MILFTILISLGIKSIQCCPTLSASPTVVVNEHSDAILNCSCPDRSPLITWRAITIDGTLQIAVIDTSSSCNIQSIDYKYIPANTSFTCSDDFLWFTMKLPNVDRTFHGSKYLCEMFISVIHKPSENTSVFVRVPVEYVNISGDFRNVIENQLSQFTCTSSKARPESKIEWFITNGTTSSLFVDYASPNDDDALVSTVSTLSYRFNRSDAGSRLYCIAMNIDGYSVSSNAERISVKFAPDTGPTIGTFTNGSLYTLIEGQLQNLTCYITGGNPVPRLTWDCYSGNVTDLSAAGTVRKQVRWSTFNRKNGICLCRSEQIISGTMVVLLFTTVYYPPSVPKFYANETSFDGTLVEIRGRSVVILCSSTSNPSPTYNWTIDASMPDLYRDTITIPNLQQSNEGKYNCTITNTMTPSVGARKEGTSTAVFSLTLLYPPKAPTLRYSSSQLADGVLKAIRNDDVIVDCMSSSSPPPSYLWAGPSQRNNQRLKINKIQTLHEGMYTCTASNVMDPTVGESIIGAAQTNLSIIVMRPPSNTTVTYYRQNSGTRPLTDENLKVIEGSNLLLRCASSDGLPEPSYYWSGPVSSADDTLILTSIDVSVKGNYTCNATNIMDRTNGTREIGTQLKFVLLDILYTPVITRIEEQIFKEDEAVVVPCIAISNPVPSNYSWTRSKDDFQQASSNLTFEHVSRNDTDSYNCSVTNTMRPTGEQIAVLGKSSITVRLRVLYYPDVAISQRNGTNLTEGDKNVMLLCSADGEPANYTFGNWSQYALDGTTKIKEYRAEKYVNGTVSLTFSTANYMDSGIFVCTVSNGISDKNGKLDAITSATQVVKGKPIVISRKLKVTAAVLDNSTLEVSFYSNDGTDATVKWYKVKNGAVQEILNNSSRMFHKTKPDQVSLNFYNVSFLQTGNTSQLFIQNVSRNDFSEYEVIISNTMGPTVTKLQLNPQGPPDCPDKFEVEESTVTSSTITVTWTSGFHGGANQTFHVRYKTSSTLWQDGATVQGFTLTDTLFNATVGNLSSDTEYRFRIYAESIHGQSKCNVTKTARTMSDTVDPAASSNIGLIAGGAAGGIVLAAIVVVLVLFLLRRHRDHLKSPSKQLLKDNKRLGGSNAADDTAEINLNPMYESAGPLPSTSNKSDVYSQVDKNRKKTKLGGDIYSQVDKTKKRQNTGASGVTNDVYAQVKKKNHKTKDADKTKHKKKKPDEKTKKAKQTEDVYDNVDTLNSTVSRGDAVYENPSCSIEDEHPKQIRNQDGLIYADLDLPKETIGKDRIAVIHGLDDRTDYADIKYGEIGEQAAESDEENTKKE